jgi:hypothetical protein
MVRCHVSVRRIIIKSALSSLHRYSLSVGSLPAAKGVAAPAPFASASELTCPATWCVLADEKLCIILSQETFLGQSRVATVLVPFAWLPRDRVVEQWLPMKLAGRGWSHPIRILVKIHLDTRDLAPFAAPMGSLLVTVAPDPAHPDRFGQPIAAHFRQAVPARPPQAAPMQQMPPFMPIHPAYVVPQPGSLLNYPSVPVLSVGGVQPAAFRAHFPSVSGDIPSVNRF